MIAKTISRSHFGQLARYLAFGRSGSDEDRVAWMEARNLPTRDVAVAAKYMRATAAVQPDVREPVYHLIVSFDPRDRVTDETLSRTTERVLSALRLEEYQALVVAHRDRAHTHLHLAVNRVHPATGKAWDRWGDWPRLERVLRQLEHELHLTAVREPSPDDRRRRASHHLEAPSMATPDDTREVTARRTNAQATEGEYQRARRLDEQGPLITRAQAVLPVVRDAESWRELHVRLAERGLTVERKGQGLVVTDGREEVKASRVSKELSTVALEARLGPFVARTEAALRADDGPSVRAAVRALAAYEQGLGQARDGDFRAAQARTVDGLGAQLAAARDRFDDRRDALQRLLPAVYTNPDAALRRFEAGVRNGDADRAVRAFVDDPERYGALVRVEQRRLGGLVRTGDERQAREQAVGIVRVAGEYVGARTAMEDTANGLRAARADGEWMTRMPAVYQRPEEATRRVLARVEEAGIGRAAVDLRERPERFGALRVAADADLTPVRQRAEEVSAGLVQAASAVGTRVAEAQATRAVQLGANRAANDLPVATVRPDTAIRAVSSESSLRVSTGSSAGTVSPPARLEDLERDLRKAVARLDDGDRARLGRTATDPAAARIVLAPTAVLTREVATRLARDG